MARMVLDGCAGFRDAACGHDGALMVGGDCALHHSESPQRCLRGSPGPFGPTFMLFSSMAPTDHPSLCLTNSAFFC